MQSTEVNQEAYDYHSHDATCNSVLGFCRDFSCSVSSKFSIYIAVESLHPDNDEICMQRDTDPIWIKPGKEHVKDDQLNRPEKW